MPEPVGVLQPVPEVLSRPRNFAIWPETLDMARALAPISGEQRAPVPELRGLTTEVYSRADSGTQIAIAFDAQGGWRDVDKTE